jgi:hypothetical protein
LQRLGQPVPQVPRRQDTTTIAGLRHVFDVAIEAGIVYGNPAAKLERAPVRQKQLTLPTREQF